MPEACKEHGPMQECDLYGPDGTVVGRGEYCEPCEEEDWVSEP